MTDQVYYYGTVSPEGSWNYFLETTGSTIGANRNVMGIVTLSTLAPAGGAVVTLTSSDPALVRIPVTVTIPADKLDNTFVMLTGSSGVRSDTGHRISELERNYGYINDNRNTLRTVIGKHHRHDARPHKVRKNRSWTDLERRCLHSWVSRASR